MKTESGNKALLFRAGFACQSDQWIASLPGSLSHDDSPLHCASSLETNIHFSGYCNADHGKELTRRFRQTIHRLWKISFRDVSLCTNVDIALHPAAGVGSGSNLTQRPAYCAYNSLGPEPHAINSKKTEPRNHRRLRSIPGCQHRLSCTPIRSGFRG